MKKFALTIFLTFLLTSLPGCGNGHVSFGGKVTFEEDGSPLTVGTVVFSTDTFQAESAIQPDGTYQLGSISSKDGLPVGTYKVFVSGAGTFEGEKFISSIDLNFADRTKTPLTAEVTASQKTFDFKVSKPNKPKK